MKKLLLGCLAIVGGMIVVVVAIAIVGAWFSSSIDRAGTTANTNAAERAPGPDAKARQKILSTLKPEKDEFQQATFYKHPRAPALGTQIQLYIVESGDRYSLRLLATYEGDDWVFWRKLHIKVGERVVTLDAGAFEVKRENSSGTVWEVLDAPVASAAVGDEKLNFNEKTALTFATIMKAESMSMRFEGQRVSDRKVPKAELTRFQEVGMKYMALFGLK